MYDELLRQNIIIEFQNLVNNADNFDEDLDSYANFMKEVILNTYGVN